MPRSELFVPGRVCLLGEHTDWASSFQGQEFPGEKIKDGHCLVYGTNCGLYATAEALYGEIGVGCPSILRFRSVTSRVPNPFAHHSGSHPVDHHAHGEAFQIDHDATMASAIDINLKDESGLEQLANEGGFFSYVAGAAYEMIHRFKDLIQLDGVVYVIDNYLTDLPVGKGLSSSAAVCVLTARALAAMSQISLTTDEEMDIAFCGERRTPSRCGRMDQCVAFGRNAVSMKFSRDGVSCSKIEIPHDVDGPLFHFVVADMHRGKDTQRILADLSSAFESDDNMPMTCDGAGYDGATSNPGASLSRNADDTVEDEWTVEDESAALPHDDDVLNAADGAVEGEQQSSREDEGNLDNESLGQKERESGGTSAREIKRNARNFLGQLSASFVELAEAALRDGDAARLGDIFAKYQSAFDESLMPLCPSELTSLRLHELLADEDIAPFVFGGKGVGSQGDGSIQFVCKDRSAQETVATLLTEKGCTNFKFEL